MRRPSPRYIIRRSPVYIPRYIPRYINYGTPKHLRSPRIVYRDRPAPSETPAKARELNIGVDEYRAARAQQAAFDRRA